MFIVLQLTYFLPFTFCIQLCVNFRDCQLQQSLVPLQFSLPDVAIAMDVTSAHWASYFQGSGLPLSVSGSWLGFMCSIHIALQELQEVALMLHRWPFGYLVRCLPYSWIILLQKLVYVMKVVQYPFFFPDLHTMY